MKHMSPVTRAAVKAKIEAARRSGATRAEADALVAEMVAAMPTWPEIVAQRGVLYARVIDAANKRLDEAMQIAAKDLRACVEEVYQSQRRGNAAR